MATEAQIAASRRNAQKSTGPRSRAGIARASQNARRHGLAASLSHDEPTLARIAVLVGAFVGTAPRTLELEGLARTAAETQLALEVVRTVKASVLECQQKESTVSKQMVDDLKRFDRYERRALSRRRRAIREIDTYLAIFNR